MAYRWVHQVAHVLTNEAGRDADGARTAVRLLGDEIGQHRPSVGSLAPAITHFLKVTARYAPGLVQCDTVPGLPRTNNDLEHTVGSARSHERRATGRKGASSGRVVRGAVRVVAAVVTRTGRWHAEDLRPRDRAAWRRRRGELEVRHAARRARHRFRRDPAAYLAAAAARLIKLSLPP